MRFLISYIDQQVADSLDSLLKATLSDSYIIKEDILKDLPTSIVDSFIHEYALDSKGKGINIPIVFTKPGQPLSSPYILVQFVGSSESPEDSPLGLIEGNISSQAEGDVVKEIANVSLDTNNNAYITLSNNAYEVYSIKEISSFKFTKGDNKVYVKYIPSYSEGAHKVHITYSKYRTDSTGKQFSDSKVSNFGINTIEGISIDVCSTNMDILRCLFGLMYVITIYLRTTIANNYNVYSPQLTVEGTDLLDPYSDEQNSVSGQQLFSRRFKLTYKVTQAVSPKAGEDIKNIFLDKG